MQTQRNIGRSIVLVLAVWLAACAQPGSGLIAQIDSGKLQGTVIDDVTVFKGIPYAAPPVGEWRWRPPQRIEPWEGVRSAEAYSAFCAQPKSSLLWFQLGEISEDCLTLNVWTPKFNSTAKLPVMVWIHGGGFSQGSGNIARLNSPAVAKQGVILVTINYRLALFGFMVHPAVSASHPDEPTGNYGLMDSVAALQWIQRNIAAFGGDPGNVTIFGESAGAGSVNHLLVMPSSAGLFHRAISQSSSTGIAPGSYIDRRAGYEPAGETIGIKFVDKLGVGDDEKIASTLRGMTTEKLLAGMGERDRFTPVIDGTTIPDQLGVLYAQGKQHKVPYMNGGVSWEASLGRRIGGGFSPEFAAKLVPAADQARLYPGLSGEALEDRIFGDIIIMTGSRHIANSMFAIDAPVYSFYFSYVPAGRRGKQPGVAHADDIAFVMRTLETEQDLDVITDRDQEVAALISAYWVQFAKTGNPNGADRPEWPAYDPDTARVLEIGDEIIVHDDFLAERLAYHLKRGGDLLERSR